MQTYWLDVLEFATYVPNNQYYLAAKYGGFNVPSDFGDPYARVAPLQAAWWRTNTDTVGAQPRPDNYFTVARPDQMVAGLTKAFANIAAALRAYTTSFSTSLPQVALTGNGSYSAQFDSSNWTGEVVASALSFDAATGAPTQVTQWSLDGLLGAQLAGAGWDTGRRVLSWNTATSAGVPFRLASLAAAQQSALDPSYVSRQRQRQLPELSARRPDATKRPPQSPAARTRTAAGSSCWVTSWARRRSRSGRPT